MTELAEVSKRSVGEEVEAGEVPREEGTSVCDGGFV